MSKFEITHSPLGATFIRHNLEPNFVMRVLQNDDSDYNVDDIFEVFEFRGNIFVLVIEQSEVGFDEVEDFRLIRSIIRRAWHFYRSQVHIEKYVPEIKEGDLETERYLLKPSARDGWWVCADKEAKIVIKWKEHLFNDTQEATELEDLQLNVTEIARVLREMNDWLRENHYNKIF